jgi:hypothetical protein
MYFFLVLVVIILVTLNYYVSQYKQKAIQAGESELSLTDKNVLSFCRTCKICSGISFLLMIITGFLIIIAPAVQDSSNWIFLSVTREQWLRIHLFIGVIFILSFAFHTYIHWNWFKAAFIKRVRPSGKTTC